MSFGLIAQADSISTQVSEKEISGLIKSGNYHELLDRALIAGIDFLSKILLALVIFLIGKWLIARVGKVFNKVLSKRKIDIALRDFLGNLVNIFLFMVLFIVIINIVGTKTISIAALIGSAGLAIGLAVKDNLANFAGGVMLLFNKPFKIGDYIEAQSLAGTVRSIGILYTTLTTPDNKTINIPNGPLSTGNITNISTQPTRRISIDISIQYGTDIETVKDLLLQIAAAHPLVLKEPQPFARMTAMGEHALNFTLRVWAKNKNFWTVTHDLNEEIYNQINTQNLIIPFRQMTVHLQESRK